MEDKESKAAKKKAAAQFVKEQNKADQEAAKHNHQKSKMIYKRKETKGHRRFAVAWGIVTWLCLVAAAIYFYYIFQSFKMFPGSWRIYLMYGLGGVALFTGLLVFIPKVMSLGKILTGVVNVLLCGALVFGSLYLPSVRAKIEIMFEKVPTEGELEINFYVLTDAYKAAHPAGAPAADDAADQTDGQTADQATDQATDQAADQTAGQTGEGSDSGVTEEAAANIADYKDSVFIVQKTVDKDNQDYAMLVLKRELRVDDVKTLEVETLWEAADALRSGAGDVMVLNSTYLPILQDVTGYEEFTKETKTAYTVKKKLVVSSDPGAYDMTTQPFSILIAGIDEWDEVYTTGRTDVDIIATVNPVTKQVLFTSFPRDSYVGCPYLGYAKDKLTHLGIYGIQNTVDGLADYMDVDIQYYIVINFASLVKIIDAIGGLDIDNPYGFNADSIDTWRGYFDAGPIHLTGGMALAYVRERHDLTGGDFDRIEHQDIVIKALVDKVTTPAVITSIDSLLTALDGSFKTNVSMDSIYALCQMQLDDMAVWNMVSYSLSGSTGMNTCAAMGTKTKLSVVYLKDSQVNYVKGVMDQVVNGETITQSTLP